MLSIVIPTLNEEKYLPLLLESIKRQDFKDYEIIVADAGSKDNTKKIAKKYGYKVVKGGLPGVGRNKGAKNAKGDLLLFLDSDVILKNNFLKDTIKEFNKRKLGIATCYINPISKKIIVDKFIMGIANIWLWFNQYFNPNAAGFCIFSKKKIHEKLKGFDESLKNSEDHDYVKRGIKFTKFRVLRSSRINVSMRRFDKEGRFSLVKKYIYFTFYRIFKGEIKEDIQEYEFGNF